MNYCPECGARLIRRWIAKDERERLVCASCSRIHYENPKVLVLCMAHWENRLLMGRRAQAPAQGLWSVPAGFLETGENLEEAAARETREETGVVIDPRALRLYFIASLPHINEVYIGYRVKLTQAPTLCAGAECLDVALYSRGDFPVTQLAFHDMLLEYYAAFFSQLACDDFPIMKMQVRYSSKHTSSQLIAQPVICCENLRCAHGLRDPWPAGNAAT